ncbi:hypothetical protein MLC35_05290 [Sulfurimonas sp. NW7]
MAQFNEYIPEKSKQNPKQEDATEAFESLATRPPEYQSNFQVPVLT